MEHHLSVPQQLSVWRRFPPPTPRIAGSPGRFPWSGYGGWPPVGSPPSAWPARLHLQPSTPPIPVPAAHRWWGKTEPWHINRAHSQTHGTPFVRDLRTMGEEKMSSKNKCTLVKRCGCEQMWAVRVQWLREACKSKILKMAAVDYRGYVEFSMLHFRSGSKRK